MPSAHARFAPSSMKRIIKCPGSVAAQEARPRDQDGTVFTRKGTAAHAMCEHCLKTGQDIWEFEGDAVDIHGVIQPPEMADEDHCFMIDGAFCDAVELYLQTVEEICSTGAAATWIEERVYMDHIDPDYWGTSDFTAYFPSTNTLYVVDYKNGYMPVEVDANEQALSYASGAVRKLKAQGYISPDLTIKLVIVQPNAEHGDGTVRAYTLGLEELEEFELDAAIAIQRAKQPGAERVGGSHCTFCTAMADCPAYRAYQTASTGISFQEIDDDPISLPEPDTLTPDQLSVLWENRKAILSWMEAVKKHILKQSDRGICPTGLKLVQTRATRHWRGGVAATVAGLEMAGMEEADFTVRRLISPAALERRLGKKKAAAAMEGLVFINTSSRTLVPLADKRQAITPGLNFQEVDD